MILNALKDLINKSKKDIIWYYDHISLNNELILNIETLEFEKHHNALMKVHDEKVIEPKVTPHEEFNKLVNSLTFLDRIKFKRFLKRTYKELLKESKNLESKELQNVLSSANDYIKTIKKK